MNVLQNVSAKNLNDFVAAHPQGHFLQSFEWGEFQQAFGDSVTRVVIGEGEQIFATATLIQKDFGFGKHYLYCPRGPLVAKDAPANTVNVLLQEIQKIAQQKGSLFLRVNPEETELPTWLANATKAPNELEPKTTLILDITKPREELLAGMKPKTRYNIRLADKKEIIVTSGTDTKLVEQFLKLNEETSSRDRFTTHSDAYYQKQVSIVRKVKNELLVFVAEAKINGVLTPIAANIVSYFGRRATYLHGASGNQGRNLMAPFLLQWLAIIEAQRVGATEYDFWGIADTEDPTHPWAGISRFKRGFGGSVVQYIGAYDLIYKPLWYKIYRGYKALRK